MKVAFLGQCLRRGLRADSSRAIAKAGLMALSVGVTLAFASCSPKPYTTIKAERGILDLRSWDFAKDGEIALGGEAAFYWQALVNPETIDGVRDFEYLPVATNWNLASSHPARGYATYRLRILLPGAGLDLGFFASNQDSSYVLWLNGKKVSSNGIVSADPSQAVPQFYKRAFSFHCAADELDLVMQVSNYHVRNGGWGNNVYVGTPEMVEEHAANAMVFALIPPACFLLLSLYHFLNFLLRVKERGHLYYAGFLFFVAASQLLSGHYPLYWLFPDFPWELGFKMLFIAPDFVMVFLFFYFRELFPDEFPYKPIAALALVHASFILCKIVLPPFELSSWLTTFSHVWPFIPGAAGSVCLLVAFIRRRENSIPAFFGLVALLALWLYDALAYNALIVRAGISLLPLGFIGFIILNSLILARRFALAYARCDAINLNLESEVSRRTEELSKAKYALEESDRSRMDFFLQLSHEVRTPLSVVINALDEVVKDYPGDSRLSALKHQLDILVREITEFFDMVRIDKGIHVYSCDVKIDLTIHARRMAALYRSLAASRGIEFREEIEDGIILKADPLAADRLINNMLSNAITHNISGGFVRVMLGRADQSVVLVVENSGQNLAAEDVPRLFDPYFRGSSATLGTGSGLGLSIARRIVELLGGSIEVDPRPSGGASFTVRLPVEQGGYETIPWAETADTEVHTPCELASIPCAPPPRDAPLILLVEDNDELASLIVRGLSSQYRFQRAYEGSEALATLGEALPDLIISDVMMRGMDGFELLEKVKAREEWRSIPFLFLTAAALDACRKKAYGMGALDYIHKPFRMDDLAFRVRSLLDHEALRRESEEKKRFASLGLLMSVFAHEVLNPLSGISGPVDILLGKIGKGELPEECAVQLRRIDNAVERIERLIRTLRDLHAERPLDKETVDLGTIVDAVIASCRVDSRVAIGSRVASGVLVQANSFALEQIMRNVVSNALEAMPEGGNLDLQVLADANGEPAGLKVRNTGTIPDLGHDYFEPWVSGKRGGHMGIGLYIVKTLCDSQGWSCELSPEEGGASFTIVFGRPSAR